MMKMCVVYSNCLIMYIYASIFQPWGATNSSEIANNKMFLRIETINTIQINSSYV